jgi:hypothetical protein
MSKVSRPQRTQLQRPVKNDDELSDSAAGLVGILVRDSLCRVWDGNSRVPVN